MKYRFRKGKEIIALPIFWLVGVLVGIIVNMIFKSNNKTTIIICSVVALLLSLFKKKK